VPLPARAGRVVALAPSIVEVVFALGAGDRLAGVTEGSDHPEAAAALPSVGGMANPSLERVLSLDPDLVLATTEGNRPTVALRLEELGIPVVVVDREGSGLEGVWETVLQVGAALGEQEAAGALVADGRRRLQAVRDAVGGRERPRALMLVWSKPPVAAGPGTYLHDLLEAAGAENAAASLPAPWPRVGREALLRLAPEVIVVADAMQGPGPGLEELREMPGLPAAQAGRVVRIEGDALLRPAPRALDALPALVGALHPGVDVEAAWARAVEEGR
jgi:iron complex transport system substrate-binding protein